MKKFSTTSLVMAATLACSAVPALTNADPLYDLGVSVCAAEKLSAPTDIKTSSSSDSITISWSKVKGADAYSVYKYDSASKKYVSVKSVTGTSCKVTDLKKSTTYYFKVAALVKSGDKYVLQELSSGFSAKTTFSSSSSASDPVKTAIEKAYSGTKVTYSSKSDKYSVVKQLNTDKSAKLSAAAKKTWNKKVQDASYDADDIGEIIFDAGKNSSYEYILADKNNKILLKIEDGEITYNYSSEKTVKKQETSKSKSDKDDKGHEEMKDEIRKMYKKIKGMDVTVSYMAPSDTYTVKYTSTYERSEVEKKLKSTPSYANTWDDKINDAELFVDDVLDMLDEKGYSSTVIFEFHDKTGYPLFKVKNGEESYNYADSVY